MLSKAAAFDHILDVLETRFSFCPMTFILEILTLLLQYMYLFIGQPFLTELVKNWALVKLISQ